MATALHEIDFVVLTCTPQPARDINIYFHLDGIILMDAKSGIHRASQTKSA